MRNNEKGHLKSLDGLRGVAILMVICSHAFSANFESGGTAVRFLGNAVGYGLFGVDLFFVLSGFLITGLLVDSVEGDGFFSNFYMRRILRIFPLYYAVLLGLFLLTPVLHLEWKGMGWLLLGYLQNLRPEQIVTYSPGADLHLNHFWSLAIEEQFYLVWPAVIFLVRERRKLLLITVGGSILALIARLTLLHWGASPFAIHVSTLTRADTLLLGGALAILYRSAHWERVTRAAPWGLATALAILLASIAHFGGEFSGAPFSAAMRTWISGPRYTVLAFGGACLICCALNPGSLSRWVFERPWLRLFGKYSYGIYMLHMIALSPFLTVFRRTIQQQTHSKLLAVAGAGISALALSFVVAFLSFHLLEKPFLRLKRRFVFSPKAAEPVSPGTVIGVPAQVW